MKYDAQNPYPVDQVFSRQQLRDLTGIPDDVLGFWIKEELLVPLPAEPREHRRFSYEQLNVAVILNAMRSLGANIGVLRAFARGFQHGIGIIRRENISYDDIVDIRELHEMLINKNDGIEISIHDDSGNFIETRITSSELEIIKYWRNSYQIVDDEHCKFLVNFAESLDHHAMKWVDLTSDVLNPRILMLDIEMSGEPYSLAWVDVRGEANIAVSYDGNSVGKFPDNAALYIPFAKLIRALWADRIIKPEEQIPGADDYAIKDCDVP